jgi:hypothetical protein
MPGTTGEAMVFSDSSWYSVLFRMAAAGLQRHAGLSAEMVVMVSDEA